MRRMSSADPQVMLESVGQVEDTDINLAQTALALAAAERPGLSLERYINHIEKLSKDVAARHAELLDGDTEDNVETQLAALKDVLVDKHGYRGDEEDYDNLENASLIGVIDRGKGMPIALSVLYIQVARGQGWDVAGLNIPGHFVCRLQKDGQIVIFDPFDDCNVLQASDMRQLVKKALGEHAELSSDYHEAMSNRDILIRLQNNIKLRQIEAEDYEAALKTVEQMSMIAPDEYRLLLDAGVLYARTGESRQAIDLLEAYIDKTPDASDRHDIAIFIQQIRESMD